MSFKFQIAAFSFLCIIGHNYSQQNAISYIEKVQVDGKMDEWPRKKPLISFMQDNPIKKNANQVKIYAGWNELYLFILFSIDDKNLISLTNDSIKGHLNDAVEFFIDPLSDSRDKMDVNDYQFIVAINGKITILKGDYRKTDSIDYKAPKEHGITTMVFKSATYIMGKINQPGVDTGYQVEMAIPFSAIGIEPKEGIFFKADFCVDDADSLVDIASITDSLGIPGFFYSSWKGGRDFSFPTDWSVFTLKGKPTWLSQFIKTNAVMLWWTVIIIVIISSVIIFLLIYRIRQLKNVPKKSSIQQFEQIQQYIDDSSSKKIEQINEPGPVIAENISTEEPEVIKKARNYILKHIENEVEIDKLASACAVSSRQLQRIFKEHLTITPGSFIVILKMEEAEKLLKSGKYNVTEVAYHLSYSDAAYFTRVFKKYFGYPPRQVLV